MIDLESAVFSAVAIQLRAAWPGVFVSGEPVAAPAQFPTVTIVEADNSVYGKMSTTTIENFASLVYEVNVCSNKTAGKKQECKEIMAVIDEQFAELGFTRKMCNQVPNLADHTIYRMVARYTGVADRDARIYTK